MKTRNIYFTGLVFLATALVSAIPMFAAEETSTMTCDEGVVQDTCGQPDNQSMDEWVYDFGPSQPVYTLIFKDGKVVRILEGERSN
jgi:hypothetical protein